MKKVWLYSLRWSLFPAILIFILFPAACGFSGERQHMDHFRSLDTEIPPGSTLRLDDRNKTVIFLRGENLSGTLEADKIFAELRSKSLSEQIAMAFLSAHHELFKLENPFHELKTESLTTDDLGYTHVKFQQIFEKIPVLNSEIIVHLNRLNQVNSINGRYIPTPSGFNTRPEISQEQAVGRVSDNFADKPSVVFEYLPELTIYVTPKQAPRLAYRVAVHSSIITGGVYIVDARTGDVLTKFSTIYDKKQ